MLNSYGNIGINRKSDVIPPFPLKLSVIEDGLMAKTCLTIKIFTWNSS